jgi:hypothetical protein
MRIIVPTLTLAREGKRLFHSERPPDPCTSLRKESCHEPSQRTRHDSANSSTHAVQQFAPASDTSIPATLTPTAAKIKELISNLEVPFHPSVIELRVTNTSKGGPPRGQVMPYADQRAYTDRRNALFTPAGWTRRYTIHTSANFERSKDQKIVAKVLATCELTIFGVGSHSATGEEFADDENAGTSAEAQAFKRACACFGLGRYLYYFTGTCEGDSNGPCLDPDCGGHGIGCCVDYRDGAGAGIRQVGKLLSLRRNGEQRRPKQTDQTRMT